jgi:hypothetical protein
MPASDGVRGHVQAGQDVQWFVLTDELDVDEAQATGRWLKTTDVVEARR